MGDKNDDVDNNEQKAIPPKSFTDQQYLYQGNFIDPKLRGKRAPGSGNEGGTNNKRNKSLSGESNKLRPQNKLRNKSLPTLAEESASSLYGVAGQPSSVETEQGMGVIAARAFRGSSDVCRSEGAQSPFTDLSEDSDENQMKKVATKQRSSTTPSEALGTLTPEPYDDLPRPNRHSPLSAEPAEDEFRSNSVPPRQSPSNLSSISHNTPNRRMIEGGKFDGVKIGQITDHDDVSLCSESEVETEEETMGNNNAGTEEKHNKEEAEKDFVESIKTGQSRSKSETQKSTLDSGTAHGSQGWATAGRRMSGAGGSLRNQSMAINPIMDGEYNISLDNKLQSPNFQYESTTDGSSNLTKVQSTFNTEASAVESKQSTPPSASNSPLLGGSGIGAASRVGRDGSLYPLSTGSNNMRGARVVPSDSIIEVDFPPARGKKGSPNLSSQEPKSSVVATNDSGGVNGNSLVPGGGRDSEHGARTRHMPFQHTIQGGGVSTVGVDDAQTPYIVHHPPNTSGHDPVDPIGALIEQDYDSASVATVVGTSAKQGPGSNETHVPSKDYETFHTYDKVADSAVTREIINSILAPSTNVVSKQTMDSLPSSDYKTLSSETFSSGSYKSATQMCLHDFVPAPRYSVDYGQKIPKNQQSQGGPWTSTGTHYVQHTATPVEADKTKAVADETGKRGSSFCTVLGSVNGRKVSEPVSVALVLEPDSSRSITVNPMQSRENDSGRNTPVIGKVVPVVSPVSTPPEGIRASLVESHAITHATTKRGSLSLNRHPLVKIPDDVTEEHQLDDVSNEEHTSFDDVNKKKMSDNVKEQKHDVTRKTDDVRDTEHAGDDVIVIRSEINQKSDTQISSDRRFSNTSDSKNKQKSGNRKRDSLGSTSSGSLRKSHKIIRSQDGASNELGHPQISSSFFAPKCQTKSPKDHDDSQNYPESKPAGSVDRKQPLNRATSIHSDFSSTFSSSSSSGPAVIRKDSKNEDRESSAAGLGLTNYWCMPEPDTLPNFQLTTTESEHAQSTLNIRTLDSDFSRSVELYQQHHGMGPVHHFLQSNEFKMGVAITCAVTGALLVYFIVLKRRQQK